MFKKIKDALRIRRALKQYEQLTREIDMNDSKNVLKSKTFWANVLGLALTVGGLLPQKWAVPVIAVANIGLRLISSGDITILPGK